MVKIKVLYWWSFQHRTESICGGSLVGRFHCWRVMLALLKHFIVSIVVIRRGSKLSMARAIVSDLLSWTPCLVLWQDGNWPNLHNERHLILVKADQKGRPFYSSRTFCALGVEVLSCSEIKEKNPSSRLWIRWFFFKEIFLLGFSGLLLICNSSEWVKNVFWSHTNMWSSEHWWHSTTKENQGVRGLEVTLRQKELPQWSMYLRRGYRTYNERTVTSWHFISDSLLNYLERMHWSHSPGNSQKLS